MGPIILATQFTSSYHKDGEEYQRSPSPKISPQKARGLIAETLSVNGEEADKASFDCARASTRVEEIICAQFSSDLRTLDREMARA